MGWQDRLHAARWGDFNLKQKETRKTSHYTGAASNKYTIYLSHWFTLAERRLHCSWKHKNIPVLRSLLFSLGSYCVRFPLFNPSALSAASMVRIILYLFFQGCYDGDDSIFSIEKYKSECRACNTQTNPTERYWNTFYHSTTLCTY